LIVAINFADFEYVWPRDPLVTELAALLSADDVGERAEQLFAQAFGPRALKVLAAMRSPEEVRALVLKQALDVSESTVRPVDR
jgi:hypothetical protein